MYIAVSGMNSSITGFYFVPWSWWQGIFAVETPQWRENPLYSLLHSINEIMAI